MPAMARDEVQADLSGASEGGCNEQQDTGSRSGVPDDGRARSLERDASRHLVCVLLRAVPRALPRAAATVCRLADSPRAGAGGNPRDNAAADGDTLEVSYDLLQATAEQIEARLVEAGVGLGQGWAERLRRAFVHYEEECETGNLAAPGETHCHGPDTHDHE